MRTRAFCFPAIIVLGFMAAAGWHIFHKRGFCLTPAEYAKIRRVAHPSMDAPTRVPPKGEPDQTRPVDGDTQWIIPLVYINHPDLLHEKSTTVVMNYLLLQKGTCSLVLKNMVEAVLAKLKAAGFTRIKAAEIPKPIKNDVVYLIMGADTRWSPETNEWTAEPENITLLVISGGLWHMANVRASDDHPPTAEQVDEMAEEIMRRLDCRPSI